MLCEAVRVFPALNDTPPEEFQSLATCAETRSTPVSDGLRDAADVRIALKRLWRRMTQRERQDTLNGRVDVWIECEVRRLCGRTINVLNEHIENIALEFAKQRKVA